MKQRSLHQQLTTALRTLMATKYQVGQRFATISELARRFKVSDASVRSALLTLECEGLIELRHGSGTYVSDSPPVPEIGVLMEFDLGDVSTSFFYRRVASQVRAILEQQGYLTRLYAGFLSPTQKVPALPARDFLADVAEQRLAGLVVVSGVSHKQCVEDLRRWGTPVVGPAPSFEYGIKDDHGSMVHEGVRRLVAAGRRKLGFLAWDLPGNGRLLGTPPSEIFRSVLSDLNISVNPQWIRTDLHPGAMGSGWEEFREVWSSSREKPDGLLVCDDVLFQDVIPAIVAAGVRVPEELMVVTHAVKGSRMHCPFPVWRMEYDPDEYADAMAGLLIKQMRGERIDEPVAKWSFKWVAPDHVEGHAVKSDLQNTSTHNNRPKKAGNNEGGSAHVSAETQ